MKRIVALLVVIIFAAIFGYQFGSNIKDFVNIFKNIKDMSADIFTVYGRVIITTIYSFGGLLGSVLGIIRIALGKMKHSYRVIGSLITTLLVGFVFTQIVSAIPNAVKTGQFDVLKSGEYIRMYVMLGFAFVVSIGFSFKTSLIRSIVASVGLAGVIIIDALLMKEIKFSMDYLKYLPQLTHIYIFIIVACAAAGLFLWWKDDKVAE